MRITQQLEITAVTAFYNLARNTSEGGLCLRPISANTASWWFFGDNRVTFAAMEGENLIGLASGAYLPERKTGYLSYLCVLPEHRGQGIAHALMDKLEAALLSFDGCEKLDVVFHNPVNLPWYINEDGGHHHPCVPGADVSSGLSGFLAHRGWSEFVRQNAYYRPLEGYADPPHMAEVRARLLTVNLSTVG